MKELWTSYVIVTLLASLLHPAVEWNGLIQVAVLAMTLGLLIGTLIDRLWHKLVVGSIVAFAVVAILVLMGFAGWSFALCTVIPIFIIGSVIGTLAIRAAHSSILGTLAGLLCTAGVSFFLMLFR